LEGSPGVQIFKLFIFNMPVGMLTVVEMIGATR